MADKVHLLWENDNEPQIIAVFNKQPSEKALTDVFINKTGIELFSKITVEDAVRQIQEKGQVMLSPKARCPYYVLEEREVDEA